MILPAVVVLLNCMYLTACSVTDEASEPQEKSLHATWLILQIKSGGESNIIQLLSQTQKKVHMKNLEPKT